MRRDWFLKVTIECFEDRWIETKSCDGEKQVKVWHTIVLTWGIRGRTTSLRIVTCRPIQYFLCNANYARQVLDKLIGPADIWTAGRNWLRL